MPEPVKSKSQGMGANTPSPSITLEITPELMATVQQLARDSQQPLDVVFTRALALYQATLKAASQGNHVGYSASPDALDVEFTGIAGPAGAR